MHTHTYIITIIVQMELLVHQNITIFEKDTVKTQFLQLLF